MPAGEYWRDELGAYRQAEEERSDRARIAADDETQVAAEPEEDFYEQFDDWGAGDLPQQRRHDEPLVGAARDLTRSTTSCRCRASTSGPTSCSTTSRSTPQRVGAGRRLLGPGRHRADPRRAGGPHPRPGGAGRAVIGEEPAQRGAHPGASIARARCQDEGRMDVPQAGAAPMPGQLKDGRPGAHGALRSRRLRPGRELRRGPRRPRGAGERHRRAEPRGLRPTSTRGLDPRATSSPTDSTRPSTRTA